MTLTKIHIVEAIAQRNGSTKIASAEMVETILETIKKTLASGEDVLVKWVRKILCVRKDGTNGEKPCNQ
jgi:integration host factor subunit alpha